MGTVNILANGPISVTAKDGSQVSIPISKLSFVNGKFLIDQEWLKPIKDKLDETGIIKLLDQLRTEGVLQTVEALSPGIAMVISAADPGALGNTIQIGFSKFKRPAGGTVTFDATATEQITYKKLTPDTIVSILGSAADGLPAGLIFVSSAAPYQLPKQNGSSKLAGNPATVKIAAATGDAFELTAKKAGIDSALIEVRISDLTDTDFTLTARWSKTVTSISVLDLQSNFDYKLKFDPPVKGGQLAVPAEGVVILSGGTDIQAATSASASVIAGS